MPHMKKPERFRSGSNPSQFKPLRLKLEIFNQPTISVPENQ
ncbi:hypothetical protein BHMPCIPO_01395 [Ensifer sesbaniae]|nr:hypothetical protein [Ensifer sesbaniae]